MRRTKWTAFCLAVAAVAAAVAVAAAADPFPDGSRPPEPVVRTYDVSDLVLPVRDFPFGSAVIPPGMITSPHNRDAQLNPGMYLFDPTRGRDKEAEAPPGAEENLKNLVDLISQTVAPDSWRENGGSEGSLHAMGHVLVVSQTPDNHRKLAACLGEVRRTARSSRSVAVDAYWVLVAPAQLGAILKKDPKADPKAPAAAPAAGAEVDLAALGATATAAPAAGAEPSAAARPALHTEAHLLCLAGQTVHVSSGRARTALVAQSASVGTAAVAYDPDVDQVLAGTVMQVTPVVPAGGDAAVVEVRSSASEWNPPGDPAVLHSRAQGTLAATRPTDVPLTGGSDVSAPVDRLNMTAQQFAATVRLPLGRPVLVGGMTYEPTAAGAKADKGDGRQLYLVLRVTVVEPAGK